MADYRRAFDLNPNFALNAMFMAWGESLVGLTREAKGHAELALRLSPRDQDLWLGDAYLALYRAGELAKQEKRFREVRDRITQVDFSWDQAARQYDEIYDELMAVAYG